MQFSMTTVAAIVPGGVADREGLLRVGDIVEAVDGEVVCGRRVLSVVPEHALKVKLAVLRAQDGPLEGELGSGVQHAEGSASGGVEMSGWLFKVRHMSYCA